MSDNFVRVRYSKDGGRNNSNWRTVSLGELGEYQKRIAMRQLGTGRNWRLEIEVSSPVKRDLLGAVGILTQLDA